MNASKEARQKLIRRANRIRRGTNKRLQEQGSERLIRKSTVEWMVNVDEKVNKAVRRAKRDTLGARSKGQVDWACESCAERKRWCGFDHERRVFVKGKQAEWLEELHAVHIGKLRKMLTAKLEPNQRVPFFKLLARLEKYFNTHPVDSTKDPRLVSEWLSLPIKNGLGHNALAVAFGHLGIPLDKPEVDLILDILQTPKRRKKQISIKNFVLLCAAAQCYRRDISVFIKLKHSNSNIINNHNNHNNNDDDNNDSNTMLLDKYDQKLLLLRQRQSMRSIKSAASVS